jgi:hypothetical protein
MDARMNLGVDTHEVGVDTHPLGPGQDGEIS